MYTTVHTVEHPYYKQWKLRNKDVTLLGVTVCVLSKELSYQFSGCIVWSREPQATLYVPGEVTIMWRF